MRGAAIEACLSCSCAPGVGLTEAFLQLNCNCTSVF
jgi:hypothetical protein